MRIDENIKLLVAIMLLGIIVLSGCGKSTSDANSSGNSSTGQVSPEYTIRFGGTQPEGHPLTMSQYKFKELVEEKSEGRIKVDVFPASQLGGNVQMNEAVQQGSLTMTYSSLSYMGANFEPRFNIFSLPFIITPENIEQAYTLVDGDEMAGLNAALEEKGFKVLGYAQIGFRHITNSKRPIEQPADLAGIKIRLQPNETHLAVFRLLGANPTSMDWGEVYSALQQHVIDAQENPLDIIYTNKMYEVQKYLSLSGHFFDFAGFWMNKDFFDKLPADLQQVVLDAGAEAIQYQRQVSTEANEDYLEKLKSVLEVNEITPENLKLFQEKVRPMYADYLNDTEDKEFANTVFSAFGIDAK